MFMSTSSPGAIVKVSMGLYEHHAIISDKFHSGKPMLISLSARTGTVREEPWSDCVGNREVVLSSTHGELQSHEVLSRARSMIGKIQYGLLGSNCEHFARWAHNMKVESKQIQTGVFLLLGAVFAYATLKKR